MDISSTGTIVQDTLIVVERESAAAGEQVNTNNNIANPVTMPLFAFSPMIVPSIKNPFLSQIKEWVTIIVDGARYGIGSPTTVSFPLSGRI